MRVKVVLQKVYVAFVLLVLLTIQVSMPVVNANDEIDGSVRTFGFNNETTISGITITDSGTNVILSGLDAPTGALTRLDKFFINFVVSDLDGFDHLDVYIVLFNNDLADAETSSGVMATQINNGVTDRSFVVRWLAPERSAYLSGLSLSPTNETFRFPINSGVGESNFLVKSGGTSIDSATYNSGIVDFVTPDSFNLNNSVSWEVTSGVTPTATVTDSGVVNDFVNNTSGVRNIQYTVRIPFTMSKVAPSSGVWNLGIMVHDRLQQEITTERTDVLEDEYEYAPAYFKNQWYGEVSIVGSSGIRFTDVEAGSGFQIADQSGIDSGIQARFISNGTYSQEMISDTTWRPAVTVPNRPAFAYLVFSSGLEGSTATGVSDTRLDEEGNRFALQARRIKLGMEGDSFTEAETLSSTFIDIIPASSAGVTTENLIPAFDDAIYQLANPDKSPIGQAKNSIIAIISNAPGTDEIGVRSIFEFQLRLSAVFQNTEYSGNLSIGISNSSTPFTPE
jgi:hypothetical protein